MTTAPSERWWMKQPCLSFDVESTGVNVHEDRIVTASVVRIVPGKDPVTFDWLANPGDDIEIPEGAAAVHGITTEHAREHGRPIGDVLVEVVDHLLFALERQVPVVAMNASYDLSILEAECHRHRVPSLSFRLGGVDRIRPIIDPFVLDKYADRYRKGGRKLVDLARHWNVKLADAHTASADALAAGLIWPQILRLNGVKFARFGSPMALHDAEVGWRAEQMDGLRAYFDKNGTDHDGCCGAWPLHGTCCAQTKAVA